MIIIIIVINSLFLRVRGQAQLTPCYRAFDNRQYQHRQALYGPADFFGGNIWIE